MKRKVCVITGSRADYGLLRWLLQGIKEHEGMALQLVVTGAHLSPEFGHTYRDIESDGFHIDRRVEVLTSSDTAVGVAKSMGLGLIAFADVFHDLQPDLLLLLGDRYEIFSAAAAALVAKIPVAHLHGGELTEGAFDDSLRHAITKMASLHFVAAPEYRARVIQLGEPPERVFMVGGLGVDNIHRMQLLNRGELSASLGFEFGAKSLLVTFHPVTLGRVDSEYQMAELLAALSCLQDTQLLFTMPGADNGSRGLTRMVAAFVQKNANAKAVESLGQHRYMSCVAQVDAVVGNSSSGLTEVPSFKKATVNIGDRQQGRLKAHSVIDCEPDRQSIAAAIARVYQTDFQLQVHSAANPYGNGGATAAILKILETHPLDQICHKKFHDIHVG